MDKVIYIDTYLAYLQGGFKFIHMQLVLVSTVLAISIARFEFKISKINRIIVINIQPIESLVYLVLIIVIVVKFTT